jgi:hypothetical protein
MDGEGHCEQPPLQEERLRQELAFEEMRELPSLLWHYTNPQALISILAGRELHLTDCHYLNDSRELYHLLDHLDAHSAVYLPDGSAGDASKYWLPTSGFEGFSPRRDPLLRDRVATAVQQAFRPEPQRHLCVASFCEEGDLLSQWRAYSGTAGGVAIGFALPALAEVASASHVRLRRCRYLRDSDAPSFHISRFIGEAIAVLDQPATLRALCLQVALTVKHPAFMEEQEWRLITEPIEATESKIQFRQSRFGITPYFALSFAELANALVADVRVGPSATQDLLVSALEAAKQRFGYTFTVSRSSAPYRA